MAVDPKWHAHWKVQKSTASVCWLLLILQLSAWSSKMWTQPHIFWTSCTRNRELMEMRSRRNNYFLSAIPGISTLGGETSPALQLRSLLSVFAATYTHCICSYLHTLYLQLLLHIAFAATASVSICNYFYIMYLQLLLQPKFLLKLFYKSWFWRGVPVLS